ncbi:hypothetical protein BDK51DRAFT_26960 [Blyttiomyces helicus]|uniref:Uncharacterized protein n=1 Tax=Blyttiomyces helicus TaxID=388810 RepID=A0A4P9WDV7_9FUNG|nr:hypothetical protein BDK51DRAFT_26960 [Blyttiomyces helicus]|eukprot:RKO89935.1 hypothetical protein BDK51DRAFT_26960 [Blyttiomyces helicus]
MAFVHRDDVSRLCRGFDLMFKRLFARFAVRWAVKGPGSEDDDERALSDYEDEVDMETGEVDNTFACVRATSPASSPPPSEPDEDPPCPSDPENDADDDGDYVWAEMTAMLCHGDPVCIVSVIEAEDHGADGERGAGATSVADVVRAIAVRSALTVVNYLAFVQKALRKLASDLVDLPAGRVEPASSSSSSSASETEPQLLLITPSDVPASCCDRDRPRSDSADDTVRGLIFGLMNMMHRVFCELPFVHVGGAKKKEGWGGE